MHNQTCKIYFSLLYKSNVYLNYHHHHNHVFHLFLTTYFSAPNFEVFGEKDKAESSYAKAACSSKKDIARDLLIKKCRGERIFTDLTIETYLKGL